MKLYFNSGVENFAYHFGKTLDEAYEILKRNYDGYHFSPENLIDVYNPYSLISALASASLREFWFVTGTPRFLVKMIQNDSMELQEVITDIEYSGLDIPSVYWQYDDSLVSVLYQTGFLTIKSVDKNTGDLTIGYPNAEAEKGLHDLVKL